MFRLSILICLSLVCAVGVAADPPAEFIAGLVVDASGRPVANVDVGLFWSANGLKGFADNQAANLQDPEKLRMFWGNVGRMELWPWSPKERTRTDADGTFRVESSSRKHQVLALDADRRSGGLGVVPRGKEGEPIVIRLAPLVRVEGEIRGPETDKKPSWTHVYANRAEDPERPVDSFRIVSCGSFDARFAMLLPPGTYQLDAYNDNLTGRVLPAPTLTLTGSEGVVNLGTLHLSPVGEALVPRMTRVMAEQHIAPLKDRVGQAPPPIIAADSRGIARDWQAGRARGKWQVLEFWGLDCPACLNRSLPDLIRFQEEHAAQADRFEIVSVFMDVEGKIDTVARLDDALKPIIKHVWGGKPLPFPTLVDPSYRTSESWGLAGYGDMVLINPDGVIVAGDLATLRGILEAK